MQTHSLQITTLSFPISPDPLPPPQTRTFRHLHSIDHTAFLNDLKQTSLVTNPPESLSDLVDLYDSTLSSLLDKHAPIVTKQPARVTPSQPWFTDSLRTARRECRHAESAYRSTRSYFDYAVYKTLRNRYHKLSLPQKKLITSFWSLTPLTILGANGTYRILHRNSSIVLPSSEPLSSLASQFATFFKEKISQLRLTLSANHVQSAYYPSPLASPPDFSVFLPATEDEIIKLISDCPNKQCGLDAIPTSLLKHCCHILPQSPQG